MMWLHTPGFSEMASGGDSQRSGLSVGRRGLGRGWKAVEDVLELERVFAPDVLVGVHRVDRNHEPVPCVDAIYDQTRASWTR